MHLVDAEPSSHQTGRVLVVPGEHRDVPYAAHPQMGDRARCLVAHLVGDADEAGMASVHGDMDDRGALPLELRRLLQRVRCGGDSALGEQSGASRHDDVAVDAGLQTQPRDHLDVREVRAQRHTA